MHQTPTSGVTARLSRQGRVARTSGSSDRRISSTPLEQHASVLQEEQDDYDEDMEEVVEALKREVESKDVRLKSLVKEMEAREDALRSLRVELQGVKVRHEEALGLSEKYIAEARLSRDEEVSRLEEEFALYKNEVEARERRVEREHRDAMVSLEGKMDALKSLNGKVRQENEVLLSEMKKKESVMRDVERERQRAVNKFDAAMKSLEQLEYQYDVLEKDAKETEAVKSRRILDLEEEVEELRVSRAQEMQDGRRERVALEEELEERVEALKMAEQKYRRAEMSAAESLRREKAMQSKVEQLEELCDALKSENLSLQDEAAKARGDVERLTGAIDGASQMSKTTEHMLDGYKKEHDALKAEIEGLRELLSASEANVRDERARVEGLKATVSRLEHELEHLRGAAAAEKKTLSSEMEALEAEHKTQESAWVAEKDSLKRELEMLHGQVQVLTQCATVRKDTKPSNNVSVEEDRHEESSVKDIAHELTFGREDGSASEEAQSISFGKPQDVMEHVPAPTPHSELRQQLAALKLSLLDSTPRREKTSALYVTQSDGSEGPYLQAHRPDVGQGGERIGIDIEAEEEHQMDDFDSSSDDDALSSSDADTISKARDQVFRAKEYLRRMSSSIEQNS